MGATPETGVVNHLGQVFGYQHLYVVDGSIAPTATGRNPSHTIAAMAERIAALVI
jgi:cholesterol oxidase